MKATHVVHWPGQETLACDRHAEALRFTAEAMGFTVASTSYHGDDECKNCANEEKKELEKMAKL